VIDELNTFDLVLNGEIPLGGFELPGGPIGAAIGYQFREDFFMGLDINELMTVGAFGLGLFQLPFMLNFFGSMFFGKKVESDNPWHANSLEWSTSTPPPHLNWPGEIPTVYHGPYEFSHPNMTEDYAPQWVPIPATTPAGAGTGVAGDANGSKGGSDSPSA